MLGLRLNGWILDTVCRRTTLRQVDPYAGQWVELEPGLDLLRQGENLLEIALARRPEDLVGGVVVEDLEILVEYGIYPLTSSA